ncbi:MAG: hypothetical protein ACREQ1_13605, partial [Woeseiaceae bacterium]
TASIFLLSIGKNSDMAEFIVRRSSGLDDVRSRRCRVSAMTGLRSMPMSLSAISPQVLVRSVVRIEEELATIRRAYDRIAMIRAN